MKRRKAVGNDQIVVELIMHLLYTGVGILMRLFNGMYKNDNIVDEHLECTFIAIPKKPKVNESEHYRTTSMVSHATKILMKVLRRMKSDMHQKVNECQ